MHAQHEGTTTVVSKGNRGKKRNETVCSGGGGAQHIISKVSSLQNHSVQPARGQLLKQAKVDNQIPQAVPTLKENLSPYKMLEEYGVR